MKNSGQKAALRPGGSIVGWREVVGLPDFGITTLRAKIDTGARTSALHAENQEQFERNGKRWVRFCCPSGGKTSGNLFEAEVTDDREIKNTGGVPERRLIISTTLMLGRRRWHIDVSLADRKQMEFDLILGRTAIRRHKLLVDPGRSYLAGSPGRKSKDDLEHLQH